MKRCIAIRHVAFEDLGSFAPVLAEAGFCVTYLEAGVDDLAEAASAELLVVLGGPIGAYEDDVYPFLIEELRVIEARLKAGLPLIGICLGAQLMARALGARVYPNGGVKEIGWSLLELSPAGRDSPLAAVAGVPVLHWHGDTFDLPEGAIHLASTPITRNQAYGWGAAALGLQFHVEATATGLERWFIGHACEIGATPGLSVPQLRADTARHGRALEKAGGGVLKSFLSAIMQK